MPQEIIVWGASGHALVVVDIIRLARIYKIFGFLDSVNPQNHGTSFCGKPIFGGQEKLDYCKENGVEYIIFGFGNCQERLKLSDLVRDKGFSLATAIHPSATVANDVSVGPGTIIAGGAIVNPKVKIGENVIINTSSSIDHECVIEEGVHICPGVHLGGHVTIGRASWIGIGATVIDKVKIGAGSYIGAGAVVLNNIPDGVVAYGVPAKVIKRITNNG